MGKVKSKKKPPPAPALDALTAISPVDGRYGAKTAALRDLFSEYGLIRHRVQVEVRWLQALHGSGQIPEMKNLGRRDRETLETLAVGFSIEDARRIKELEATVNHDVKAVEYFLRERTADRRALASIAGFIHFGCTSEDINNLAYALILKEAQGRLAVAADALLAALAGITAATADMAMLARTHGQPASPTTMGKELGVFVHRAARQLAQFRRLPIPGKFNGATGNFNAHLAAYPRLDWMGISRRFVESLGLDWNPHTTQIESHDGVAEYCHALMRLNSVLLDFCRDAWGYISLGYFRQKTVTGEVGSSTMPHKVNPIDFENAEGNLGIANALLDHLAGKLPVSRWQRDLSDSTAMRNLGTALAHTLLAWESCGRGLARLEADAGVMAADLDRNWEVLAEAIQTVMRRHGIEDSYERLKNLTRGRRITREKLHRLIDSLPLPADARRRLLELTPASYTGNAAAQARRIAASVARNSGH
jgi:adenylosuccinate lyase